MIVGFLSLTLLLGCCCMPSAEVKAAINNGVVEQEKSVNPLNYPKNTRERYVACLAQQYGISYEAADQMEKKQSVATPLAADEILKYKTIDKVAGNFSDGNGYSVSPHISAEVSYVYSYEQKKAISIQSVGGPILYIPGVSNCTFNKGTFNITKPSSTSRRISVTASAEYKVSGTTISVGGDIIGISQTVGGYTVSTKAKTFSITIYLSNL